jgi:hypothetical protein
MSDNAKDIDDLMCWLSSPPKHDWDERPSEQDNRYYLALDALVAERDALRADLAAEQQTNYSLLRSIALIREAGGWHKEMLASRYDAERDAVVLTVRDNGAGIPDAVKAMREERDALKQRVEELDALKQRIASRSAIKAVSAERDALLQRVAELEAQPPSDRDRELRERDEAMELWMDQVTAMPCHLMTHSHDAKQELVTRVEVAIAAMRVDAVIAAMRKGER